MPHLQRTISNPLRLLLLTVLTCGCTAVSGMLTHGAAAPAPTGVAPKRPDATLTIAQPPAGATLTGSNVAVVVNYNGPSLTAAGQATELNQFHLRYLLDVNSSPYLETNVPVPLGNPSIIHTDKTQVSFDNVAPGRHLLAVVLTGSNHVSTNPPIAQQINFTIK
jgi:hypothetical protein